MRYLYCKETLNFKHEIINEERHPKEKEECKIWRRQKVERIVGHKKDSYKQKGMKVRIKKEKTEAGHKEGRLDRNKGRKTMFKGQIRVKAGKEGKL